MNPQSFLTDNWAILLTSALGLLAIYLLLPRPRRLPTLWGASAAAVTLLIVGWLIFRVQAFTLESALFYLFSFIAVASGCLLITVTNPARAAISFGLVILSCSGLFLLLAAPFLMAANIVVYGGAIIVTFLFVLMLAQQTSPSDADARSREPMLNCITGFVLLVTLLAVLKMTYQPLEPHLSNLRKTLVQVRTMQKKKGTDDEQITLAKTSLAQITEMHDWWKASKEPKQDDSNWALLAALENAQTNLSFFPNQTNLSEDDLIKIEGELMKVLNLASVHQGLLRPTDRRGFVQELSETSGPSSRRPASDLRRDSKGRPHMPAENASYVGRSLFSDYLLAVELGGLLLLVATVGAVAIAARRQESAESEAEKETKI